VLNYIIDEVFSFREKKTLLHRKELLPLKIALFVASIAIPLATDLMIAVAYVVILWLVLLLLGLKRATLYIVFSTATLYLSLLLVALILQGDTGCIVRPLLTASATLSIGLLTFATLLPQHLTRFQILYLLSVIFNSVLREIRDAQIVLRARGETGFKYYLRIFTVSIEVALSRIDTLVDSLKARGIELR